MLNFLINNLSGGGNIFRSEKGIPFRDFVFFNQLLIISTVILYTSQSLKLGSIIGRCHYLLLSVSQEEPCIFVWQLKRQETT